MLQNTYDGAYSNAEAADDAEFAELDSFNDDPLPVVNINFGDSQVLVDYNMIRRMERGLTSNVAMSLMVIYLLSIFINYNLYNYYK